MENSLDEYRGQFGVSQRELAEHIGVTRQTINAVERDRYDPSVELVFKLAAFFECSVDDLFCPDITVETTASETGD
ncbi:MAG: putative transcriptional regulator [Natronomonas sp.]|jgi:putative transcriptional regulator